MTNDWTEQQFIKNGYQLQQWKEIIKNNRILYILLILNIFNNLLGLLNVKIWHKKTFSKGGGWGSFMDYFLFDNLFFL